VGENLSQCLLLQLQFLLPNTLVKCTLLDSLNIVYNNLYTLKVSIYIILNNCRTSAVK
jgi:hypothetical protein